ncbi:MAG TPA: hypothetical protein PLG23_00400 [Thermoflexales bacterium]|nr:hypothetical protein [Thermoflexales bacterium]HQZ51890.1 hypothetical protein [Thermoflexales bacterium]
MQALTAAALLAACGGSAAPTMPPATSTAAPLATVTVRAPATQAPAASPTSVSTASPQPSPPAQAVGATVAPTRIPVTFKGIEQGLTADGFPYLGKADAPITLTDYSDFL